MTLEKYTNTYTDVDSNIFDAPDLLGEFQRVADYLNAWADSIDSIGTVTTHEDTVDITSTTVNIDPSLGVSQKIIIDANVESIILDFEERADGDPYRLYITLRFQSKITTFSVSGPAGETHIFSVNQDDVFLPSPVVADGYYTAMIIATYGEDNGVMINVFAHNAETSAVTTDDFLGAVAS